ncbi:MAG: O-antigen ligase family protein [Candidatus Limnocylindria bacterium]
MSAERRTRLLGLGIAALTTAFVLLGQYRPVEQPAALGLAVAAVSGAAAGAVAYLAVTRPWWGLVAWLVATPLINMARAQLWAGPLQLIAPTVIIAALVVGVLLTRRRGAAGAGAPAAAWWLLGLATALALLATLGGPHSRESLNITWHGLLEPFAVLGCVLALRPDARAAIHALAALAAGVVTAAAVNLVWLFGTLTPLGTYERRFFLARLNYFNVGIFGGMVVVALCQVGVVLLARARLGWPRWVVPLAWGAIGLLLVAIFFTYTKSAWVAATVGLTLMVLLLVRGWLRRAVLLVALFSLLAVVVPYPSPVLERIAPGLEEAYRDFVVSLQSEERVDSWDPDTEEGSGSVGIRWVALDASLELIGRHPLVGVGPGRFGPEFAAIRPDAAVSNLTSAHNLLANVAVEYGMPLALLISFAFVAGVVMGLPALDEPDPLRRVAAVGVSVTLVAFFVFAGIFGLDLYRTFRTMNADVVTLAVLLGLAVSLRSAPAGGQLPDALHQQ